MVSSTALLLGQALSSVCIFPNTAKSFRSETGDPQGCIVAVHLLHIEFSEELNDAVRDNLARNYGLGGEGTKYREARRVRNHKGGCNVFSIRVVPFITCQRNISNILLLVGQEERTIMSTPTTVAKRPPE